VKKDLRALLSVLIVATCGCNPTPVPMEMHILSSPDGELLATYYILSGHAFGTDDIRVTVRKQRGKEKTVYEGPDENSDIDPPMRWNSDRGLVVYSLRRGTSPLVDKMKIDDTALFVIHASMPR